MTDRPRRGLVAIALLACAPWALAFTPNAPVIDYPAAGLNTNIWWNPTIFYGFCIDPGGGNLTCANADVQVTTAADTGFADPIWDSYNDLGDYLSMIVDADHGVWKVGSAEETANALLPATSYLVRVRQQGRVLSGTDAIPDSGGWSAYSSSVSFTTLQTYAGTQYYVRTDGADNGTCNGLGDFPAGAGNPCAFKTLDKAMTTVATGTGARILIKNGTYTPTIVATYTANRVEIAGESRSGVILKSNATASATSNTNWISFAGDDLWIHDLTMEGKNCTVVTNGHEYLRMGNGTTDPPQRLRMQRVSLPCSVGIWMESGLTTSAKGVLFNDVNLTGLLETSGVSQALDFSALDYFTWHQGDVGGYYNIQSSNQPMGTGFHMEDLYWHNAGNHTLESRGADQITWIRPRWKRCAATFGEGIRATCQNSGPTPRSMGKGVSIINASGDDQTFYNTDNCTTGQPASNYSLDYFSRVNSLSDDSDPRAATGATVGLYMAAGAGGGNVITSGMQFHTAYNLFHDSHGKNIMEVFRPTTGANVTVSGSSGALATWKGAAFFPTSAYRPDFGSVYSTALPLTNPQGGNYTPVVGSLAIDAGDPNIRVPSGGGARIDIGAVEFTTGPTLPNLSVLDVTVDEAAGNASITIQLSAPDTLADTTGSWATANGSAVAPGDYTASSGTFLIVSNSTSTTVTVPIVNDATSEALESFTVTVSGVSANVNVQKATGTVSIPANDAPPVPTVTFTTASQTNSEATTTISVGVTLSAPSASTVTVPFTVDAGSTATAGGSCAGAADYVTPSSPITITGGLGLTTGSVSVTVCDDATDETPPGTETVILNMGSPTNATQGAITTHTATIQDNDDVAATVLTVSDVTVNEQAGTATFTVLLTPASGVTVTVDIGTQADTATAPADFLALAQTLTYTAGQTSKSFVVSIADDTAFEPTEQFFVNLSNVTGAGASIGDAQAIGTILDDDTPTGTSSQLSGVTLAGVSMDALSPGLIVPFTPRSLCTSTFDTGNIAADLAAATVTCSPAFAGSTCYQITITGCAGATTTIGSITADLRFRPNDTGTTHKGMLAGVAGGAGGGYLDGSSATAQGWTTAAAARGYSTVVIKFNTGAGAGRAGWTQTAAGNRDGHRRLVARLGTAIRWANDHLHTDGTPLGGVGSSIGSTGLVYLIQQYGFGDNLPGVPNFKWVYLGSGPVMTRIDEGCSDPSLAGATPPESDFGYPPPPTGKALVNGTFCEGSTCCSSYDSGFAADFIADENRSEDQDWNWPGLSVVLLRGALDSPAAGGCSGGNCTNAPNHQQEWRDIAALRSPMVGVVKTIAGCGHTWIDTVACRNDSLTSADDPITGMIRP